MEPIILASSSPRRQEILKSLNIPFVVNPPNIDESIPNDIKLEAVPEFLAARKINAVARRMPTENKLGWILAADTMIIHKNKPLGKPQNLEEAKEFITSIQGTTHKVVTGIALFNDEINYMSTRTSVNKVTFSPMTEKEIQWYLETDEWYGVAGGYRIQGLASCFIKKIEGTESSIMGLPIVELYDMLREQNYKFIVS